MLALPVIQSFFLGFIEAGFPLVIELLDKDFTSSLSVTVVVLWVDKLCYHVDGESQSPENGQLVVDCEC